MVNLILVFSTVTFPRDIPSIHQAGHSTVLFNYMCTTLHTDFPHLPQHYSIVLPFLFLVRYILVVIAVWFLPCLPVPRHYYGGIQFYIRVQLDPTTTTDLLTFTTTTNFDITPTWRYVLGELI